MSDLTTQEQAHVRTALKYLRARCGGVKPLALALHVTTTTLRYVASGHPTSARLAVRVARLAGVGVDELLAGMFPPEGTCPHCGHGSADVQ